MPFLPLLIFLAIPAIEITLFIEVGGWVGPWWTVALTFVTAAGGLIVVRIQGIAVLESARRSLEQGDAPVLEVLDGACLVLAGIFLILPGFFTDALGALLLTPITRRTLGVIFFTRTWFASRSNGTTSDKGMLEGDFEDVTRDKKNNPGQIKKLGD